MDRFFVSLTLLCVAGCPARSTPIGDVVGGSQGGTGGMAASESGEGSGEGEGSSGPTTADGAESSDGATEGGTSGIGEDVVDPQACGLPDDAGLGAAAFDPGDWPVDVEDLEFGSAEFSGSCEVVTVDDAGDSLAVALSCTAEGAGPYAIDVEVGAPTQGVLALAAGQTVEADGVLDNSQGGHFAGGGSESGGPPLVYHSYTIRLTRPSDGALLLAASTSSVAGAFGEPFTYEKHPACADAGCGGTVPEAPFQFTVGEPDGDSVVVTGGQYAELALLDGDLMLIDPRRAHVIDDCHFSSISIGVLRVTP